MVPWSAIFSTPEIQSAFVKSEQTVMSVDHSWKYPHSPNRGNLCCLEKKCGRGRGMLTSNFLCGGCVHACFLWMFSELIIYQIHSAIQSIMVWIMSDHLTLDCLPFNLDWKSEILDVCLFYKKFNINGCIYWKLICIWCHVDNHVSPFNISILF
jgi:hypothetical protein